MSGDEGQVTQAAGGVLWRPTAGGVEVALVHRPKYDDWSVPKGKLVRGEHALLGALREVEEETGFRAVPGRFLGSMDYRKDGSPKHVRFWSMRVRDGAFRPNTEVDQLVWLPPREAQLHLPADRDRPVVACFTADPRPTRPVVVVRHASAGEPGSWPGDDRDRPLDDVGRAQALVIADVLTTYGVTRAHSADVLRCLDTVGPFATRHHVTVEREPLLSESGFAAQPDAAVERLLTIARVPEPTVVCTQRALLPDVLDAVVGRLGGELEVGGLGKGASVVLHLTVDEPTRLVAVDRLDPPAGASPAGGLGATPPG